MSLKPRLERVLRAVIEEYIALGAPVGSKYLSERVSLGAAPSTIRNKLAELEELGMLAHPHTSAGRVPTDAGYRHYVNLVLRERQQSPPALEVEQVEGRSEIDDALRETADALSRFTELMAMVTAPSVCTSTVRHIEVLPLQRRVVMVVIITSSGQVTKRSFELGEAIDEGLTEFARDYLNERLVGAQLGTWRVAAAFESSELHPRERAFLDVLWPAFEGPDADDVEGLHLGGTSRLLDNLSREGVSHLNELFEMLEQRYNLLEILSDAMREDDVYLRIGEEMEPPSLRSCSLVAANYGVANRALGTVSVLGPTRMDYPRIIGVVRATADSLSNYLEETW